MGIAAALPVNALIEGQIVKAFRAERALSGASAKRLRDLGLSPSQTLRQMIASTVVRKAGQERFFLDEAVWATRRQLRGRTILRIGLAVGFVAASTILYAAWR